MSVACSSRLCSGTSSRARIEICAVALASGRATSAAISLRTRERFLEVSARSLASISCKLTGKSRSFPAHPTIRHHRHQRSLDERKDVCDLRSTG